MRSVVLTFGLCCPLLLLRAADAIFCEPTAETRSQLKALNEMKSSDSKTAIDKLATAQPDNVFFEERYLKLQSPKTEEERSALINRFRTLAASHAGDPMYQYLYAKSLVGKDTPQALKLAQDSTAGSAIFVRSHLLLASVYAWGKYEDKVKVKEELAKFYAACPASFDRSTLDMAQHYGGVDLAAKLAPALRQRLQNEDDPALLEIWAYVWNMEFKLRPPTEHDAVRKQLSADLARVANANPQPDAQWLDFLKDGYHLAGDDAMSRKQEDELLARFPDSSEATRLANERWYKAHPYPRNDEAKQKEYWSAILGRAEETLKRKPDDERALIDRFQAHANLKDLPPEQLYNVAQSMRQKINKDQDYFFMPPLHFEIARAYLKANAHVSEVPALIDEGKASVAAMNGLPSDNQSDTIQKHRAGNDIYLQREEASILIDAAKHGGSSDRAKEIVAQVEAQKPEKPWQKSAQHAIEAKWAELQGRKLDALLLYKAAADERPASEKPAKDDEVADGLNRLWKELGGTAASNTWLSAKQTPVAANDDGRWEKPDKNMKPWQLTDLNGKLWKLTSLEGKTLLVNVWASWCGPCKSEHPHLQELYDRLKDNPNVQIVSFNIDDEVGNVAPYMKENKYTFPVLLAKDYADELSVDSIPRNWIVSNKGQWQWEQIGFGSEDKWEDDMAAKLNGSK